MGEAIQTLMLAIYAVRRYKWFGVGYRFITDKGVQTLSLDKTEKVPRFLHFINLPSRELG